MSLATFEHYFRLDMYTSLDLDPDRIEVVGYHLTLDEHDRPMGLFEHHGKVTFDLLASNESESVMQAHVHELAWRIKNVDWGPTVNICDQLDTSFGLQILEISSNTDMLPNAPSSFAVVANTATGVHGRGTGAVTEYPSLRRAKCCLLPG